MMGSPQLKLASIDMSKSRVAIFLAHDGKSAEVRTSTVIPTFLSAVRMYSAGFFC